MSGGMVVNADDLSNFIHTLAQFDDELADSLRKLSANFATLGDVWRDAKYQEFAEIWERALAAMHAYLEESTENHAFLERKLGAITEYLS